MAVLLACESTATIHSFNIDATLLCVSSRILLGTLLKLLLPFLESCSLYASLPRYDGFSLQSLRVALFRHGYYTFC